MVKEILDIVNDKDEVIGKAEYKEIHDKKLMHRVVHAFIINDNDEVLLQLRAASKETFPLHWSFSVGGHVQHNESYEEALIREAKEEADIDISRSAFTLKGSGSYVNDLGHKVMYKTYELHYDGPIESENDEVAAMQFVSWADLKHMILDGKEKLQKEMIEILKRHWTKELGIS